MKIIVANLGEMFLGCEYNLVFANGDEAKRRIFTGVSYNVNRKTFTLWFHYEELEVGYPFASIVIADLLEVAKV